MHVILRCPCGANLKADIKLVGREMKCPKCGHKLIVPSPPVAARSEPEIMELEAMDFGTPPAAQPISSPRPPMASPLATPQQYGTNPYFAAQQSKPSQKPKAKGSSARSWIITGSIIAVVLLIFGGYLAFIYSQQRGQLAQDKGFVVQDGKRISVQDFEKMSPSIGRSQDPPPEPIPNPFDTGKPELDDPSVAPSANPLEMADLIERVEPSIVRLHVTSNEGEAVGSGFFIDREGKIITNYHVVQGAEEINVTTADGKSGKAQGFLVVLPTKDLAIIQVDPQAFNVVPIAIARELPRRGEEVAAFGAPQGFSFSATKGIISAIRSGKEIGDVLMEMTDVDVYAMLGYAADTTWIQTSAAISGGNSGGPLVNMRGEMVGVNTWTHPRGQNLNFASTAVEVVKIFRLRTPDLHDFKGLPGIRVRN